MIREVIVLYAKLSYDLTTIQTTSWYDDKFATADQVSVARPGNRLSQTTETAKESLPAGQGTVATRRTGSYGTGTGGARGVPADT